MSRRLPSQYAVKSSPGTYSMANQGASLSVNEGQRVDDAYRTPLYISMLAFYVLFFALLLSRTRTEIRKRRARALGLATA